jgi:hypothetical protein
MISTVGLAIALSVAEAAIRDRQNPVKGLCWAVPNARWGVV